LRAGTADGFAAGAIFSRGSAAFGLFSAEEALAAVPGFVGAATAFFEVAFLADFVGAFLAAFFVFFTAFFAGFLAAAFFEPFFLPVLTVFFAFFAGVLAFCARFFDAAALTARCDPFFVFFFFEDFVLEATTNSS